MTDKERILTYIFTSFYPKYILGKDNQNFNLFKNCIDDAIQVGDLVMALTSGIHEFTIGYVVEKKSKWEMTIREIGSTKTCNISNEQFYKIDISELSKTELLEGEQYRVCKKVEKALSSGIVDKNYYVMEIEFQDKKATVYLKREWKAYCKETASQITFEYEKAKNLNINDIAILVNKLEQ